MTLKVTGNQWYWSYAYPDNGDIEFDSIIVPDEELKKGQPRMLTVDNEVVLPIKTNVRLLLTSNDVIHNWAVPSLGLKLDTTPGRTNETWVNINKEGDYYGMCSELCGINHGFMPIVVEAVSKEDFKRWLAQRKPDPAPVLEAMAQLGMTGGERAVMVGDSLNDVRAGRAAGCVVIGVSYGYNQGADLVQAGAIAVIDQMAELIPRLDTLDGT